MVHAEHNTIIKTENNRVTRIDNLSIESIIIKLKKRNITAEELERIKTLCPPDNYQNGKYHPPAHGGHEFAWDERGSRAFQDGYMISCNLCFGHKDDRLSRPYDLHLVAPDGRQILLELKCFSTTETHADGYMRMGHITIRKKQYQTLLNLQQISYFNRRRY